jgi:tetratricopeptide (TPR) repeat protein
MGAFRRLLVLALLLSPAGVPADEASWRRLIEEASAAEARRDYALAATRLREAVLDATRSLGEPSVPVASTQTSLARVLISQYRHREALPVARSAYAGFLRLSGPEHVATLRAKELVAYAIMYTEERPTEAEKLYAELVESWTRIEGAKSKDVIRNLSHLGQAQGRQHRLQDAEGNLRLALAAARETYGAEDDETARLLNDLGVSIQQQGRRGRDAEAATHFRAAWEIYKKRYGETSLRTVTPLDNLADATAMLGNVHEAVGLARQSVAIRLASFGQSDVRTAHGYATLARLLAATGKPAEAEELYQRALAMYEQHYGARHVSTQGLAVAFARLLRRHNKPDDARRVENRYGAATIR